MWYFIEMLIWPNCIAVRYEIFLIVKYVTSGSNIEEKSVFYVFAVLAYLVKNGK